MKDARIGQYLLWDGKLAHVVGEIDGRQVLIELIEEEKCPHCGESLGKKQINVIVSSPLFQQNAEKLDTIIDSDTIIL